MSTTGISIISDAAIDVMREEIDHRMIMDWLPEVGLANLDGFPKIGTTTLVLQMVLAVASGTTFLKWPVENAGPVGYIGDDPPEVIHDRLIDMAGKLSIELPTAHPIHILNTPATITWDVERLAAIVRSLNLRVLCIDPLPLVDATDVSVKAVRGVFYGAGCCLFGITKDGLGDREDNGHASPLEGSHAA